MKKDYSFQAKVQVYPGPAAWYYAILPVDTAEEIDYYFSHAKHGWGSLPVEVTVGQTSWKTSIFTDKKAKSYMLPLKAEIRKAESISEGDQVDFSLEIKP